MGLWGRWYHRWGAPELRLQAVCCTTRVFYDTASRVGGHAWLGGGLGRLLVAQGRTSEGGWDGWQCIHTWSEVQTWCGNTRHVGTDSVPIPRTKNNRSDEPRQALSEALVFVVCAPPRPPGLENISTRKRLPGGVLSYHRVVLSYRRALIIRVFSPQNFQISEICMKMETRRRSVTTCKMLQGEKKISGALNFAYLGNLF